MADSIIKIKGTDLISESVNSINTNFETLYNRDSQYEQKLKNYSDLVNNTVKHLEDTINLNKTDIDRNINGLNSKLDNIPTVTNIQAQVESAIENAEGVLANVIAVNAGRYVEREMTAYAKTAAVDSKLENYITSNALTYSESKADEKLASSSTIVANNQFYKERNSQNNKNCFVYISDGTVSEFDSIENYYNNGLTESQKTNLDTNNTGKGLEDSTVVKNLITLCEQTFKTTTTELTSVKQTVSDKSATIELVAAVMSDKPNGTPLTAAILMEANDMDSSIKLNASRINIDAANKLNLTAQNCTISVASNFTIDASNFKLDDDGDVEITGKITATSGSIGGITIASNEIKSSNDKFSVTNEGKLTANDATITGNITATSGSIGLIDINNSGLVCGNTHLDDEGITVYDGNDNVSIYIGRTSYPLMCGSDNANNALTKIDANGKLYAKNAEISGDITAGRFLTTDEESITCIENDKTYSGELIKTVIIEDDNFNISSIGELTNTSDSSDKKTIDASLCIKIMDVLPNENENINGGNSFYGIPVLCMRYTDADGNENEYTISPNSWMSTNAQSDSSNMRWIRSFSLVNSYSFITPTSSAQNKYVTGNTSSFGGSATYYIFSPTYKSTFISGADSSDTLYQLTVFGDVNETQKGLLTTGTHPLATYNSSGSTPSSSSDANQQYIGAYTYGSRINAGYKDYVSGTETHITSGNCDTFKGYLMYNITGGCSSSFGSGVITSLSSNGYDKKIYNYIKSILGSTGGEWKEGSQNVQISGLDNNIPFGTGPWVNHISHKSYVISFDYYPKISIGNYGLTPNYNVSEIYVKCEVQLSARYDSDYSFSYQDGGCAYNNLETGVGGDFNPRSLDFRLNFEMYFKLNQSISDFSPSSDTIRDKIISFLNGYSGFNRSTLNSEKVKVFGTISGDKTFTMDSFYQY